MPTLDEQVAALAIGFTEMAKMLGRKQHLAVMQLANAIETAAKASGASAGTLEAASELARNLR